MSTDLLLQIVTAFPPGLKTNSLQGACMPCSDGTLFLEGDVPFLRTSASAKERIYNALSQLLPKKVIAETAETFLLIVPRFLETDVTAVHDELLRLMLRLLGHKLTITGCTFTDSVEKEPVFEEEMIGVLSRNNLTRSAAEVVVKAVRKFTADCVRTYALHLELSTNSNDVAPMKVYLLSPFVGRASNTAPISSPGWLTIFCSYQPLKGASDCNTVVLKYLDTRTRRANLTKYFSSYQQSPAQKKIQGFILSLLEAQELGAKTLTILTIINPELHKKENIEKVLHAIVKNALFPSFTTGPDADTNSLRKEKKSIHICDSSIDSSHSQDGSHALNEPASDELIKHLQYKLDAATHDQFILSQMLMKEQCARKNLEEQLANLLNELARAQEDVESERRKVTHLLKKLHEGPSENAVQTLQELNEDCSPVTTIANLLPQRKERQSEDTLDDFLCTLPIGKGVEDTTTIWDDFPGELDRARCFSGLQVTRIVAPKPKDTCDDESKQLQYLEYENTILELQQKLLENEIKASKIREQIQDEYDSKLRDEVYRIKAEVEQDFEERLRNLNPKAWYEYIKKNQQE